MKNNNLSDVPDSFVEMIRKRKAEIGIALRQLAFRADMDPATLSRILSKKQNLPSNEAILRLAEVLQIHPPDLLLVEAGRIPESQSQAKPLLRATCDLTDQDIEVVIKLAWDLKDKTGNTKKGEKVNPEQFRLSVKSLEDMSYAVQKAKELLHELGIEQIDNAAWLAKQLHIPIKYVNFRISKISGFADVDADGLPYIAINVMTHPFHQELTIAEEIGHHVLGHRLQPKRDEKERDIEAKLFACSLLAYSNAPISIAEFEDHNPDLAVLDSFSTLLILFPSAVTSLKKLFNFIDVIKTNRLTEGRETEWLATLLASPANRKKCHETKSPIDGS